MTHDEAIKKLLIEYNKSNKSALTTLFLSKLCDGEIHFGIQVYAAMSSFYCHPFSRVDILDKRDVLKNDRLTGKEYSKPILERRYVAFEDMDEAKKDEILRNGKTTPCSICSTFFCGSMEESPPLPAHNIYEMLQCLEKENALANSSEYVHEISMETITLFRDIFHLLQTLGEEQGIRDAYKQLQKLPFFKKWKQAEGLGYICAQTALQTLLEVFGWLGILHTKEFKGAFYEFYNYGNPPQSSRSSDWDYPVDFWRGKNGLDWEAFEFWFGEYHQLQCVRL